MLSDKDLVGMRECINQLMPDTCDLQTVATVPDGQGGFTEVWTTVSADVPCWLGLRTALTMVVVESTTTKPYTGWQLTLAHDVDITTDYRVICNGYTYDVTSVDKGRSWYVNTSCGLERI